MKATTFTILSILLLLNACNPATGNNEMLADKAIAASKKPSNLEIPAHDAEEHIINYSGFTSSYNHSTLVPNWVAYELTRDELNVTYDTKSSNFSRDMNLKGRQASREDYSRSGWDKGHMAPKADMRWSEKAYWESHYFTNVCPQNHETNAGDWNSLEKKVRYWAKKYGTVYVVCGPIFTSNEYGTIGNAKVAIPDMFFKAVLIPSGNDYLSLAFVMPNNGKHQSLKKYAMTVDELEETISRDLFPNLPDKKDLATEASLPLELLN